MRVNLIRQLLIYDLKVESRNEILISQIQNVLNTNLAITMHSSGSHLRHLPHTLLLNVIALQ